MPRTEPSDYLLPTLLTTNLTQKDESLRKVTYVVCPTIYLSQLLERHMEDEMGRYCLARCKARQTSTGGKEPAGKPGSKSLLELLGEHPWQTVADITIVYLHDPDNFLRRPCQKELIELEQFAFF